MSYNLFWRSPALPFVQKQISIDVPAGATVSDKSSLRFTGKGAANYGKVQQENLMRLLEAFAGDTPPNNPTVGQSWYDTSVPIMKICTATAPDPETWVAQHGTNITAIGDPSPTPPALGEFWFQSTGSVSGILHVYDGLGRYGTAGGWDQIWPIIDTAGGRQEYDLIEASVLNLIGDPLVYPGGNGAAGTLISNLTNMAALDAAKQAAWTAATPHDIAIVGGNATVSSLRATPNSNDWDTLLAAAKYAINRLELPPTMVDDISPVPFVTDGRPAPDSLLLLAPTDVRYPTNDRLVNTRYGTISLSRFYQETYNVLQAGATNRWLLKGMLGASGTNTTFDASIATTTQQDFTASAASFSGPVTHGLIYRFNSTDDLGRFFNAAQAVELLLTHNPSGAPTSADTELIAITNTEGRIRIIADATFVMTPASTPALHKAPGTSGFNQFTAGGGTVLATMTSGATSITVRGISESVSSIRVEVDIATSGAVTGTFTAQWRHINDTTMYNNPGLTRVFPIPLTYVLTDKTGSVLFA